MNASNGEGNVGNNTSKNEEALGKMENSISGPLIREVSQLNASFDKMMGEYIQILDVLMNGQKSNIPAEKVESEKLTDENPIEKEILFFETTCDQMEMFLLNSIRSLESNPEVFRLLKLDQAKK